MAKFIAALIATLTLFGAPAAYASQAAHPTHPTHPSKHQGDQQHPYTYVLRGTVNSYYPAVNGSGSITITLTSSHVEGISTKNATLTGTALTFVVAPTTHIVSPNGSGIAAGDQVLVKVRATKGLSITTLGDGSYPAQAVIDQGTRGADLGDQRGKNHEHAMATYVLRGALSSYTAASAGSIGTITVTLLPRRLWDMNLTGTTLTGTALTFFVAPTTHIVVHHGSSITNGDLGVVLVRAPKGSDTTTLESYPAQAVIDQARSGASHGDRGKDQEHSNVTYTVQGTVSNYVPANGSTDGSVTVTLPLPRFWGTPLTGTAVTATTLTFTINGNTRIVSRNGAGILHGEQVLVKVRAPKGSSLATIESIPATAIIDQAGRH